jgi:hypothetical protein
VVPAPDVPEFSLPEDPVDTMRAHPDGKTWLAWHESGLVRLWGESAAKPLAQWSPGEGRNIAADFISGGPEIILAGTDAGVLLDLVCNPGNPEVLVKGGSMVSFVTAEPAGRRLALAGGNGLEIIDPRSQEEEEKKNQFADIYYDIRKRRGITLFDAKQIMRERNYFGTMLVRCGHADALVSGLTRKYPETVRPALQLIGTRENVKRLVGMYVIVTKNGPFFFADTTININPSAEDLAEIAILTAEAVMNYNITPRIAMLSYSNFGSTEKMCSIVGLATACSISSLYL